MGFPITVIQKIIKSLLINKHVFKIRMFLLIKCDKETGTKHFYLHKLGGIFYAPGKYDEKNLSNENIIANGYWYNTIDKTDYVSFINDKPKTFQDLLKYLKKLNINTNKILTKIKGLLILVFKSIEDKIFRDQKNNQFCILGFDVMIDKNFKPWIIEFNKGPSTNNYEDSNVFNSKMQVWNDIYNLIEGKDNDFEKIYQY